MAREIDGCEADPGSKRGSTHQILELEEDLVVGDLVGLLLDRGNDGRQLDLAVEQHLPDDQFGDLAVLLLGILKDPVSVRRKPIPLGWKVLDRSTHADLPAKATRQPTEGGQAKASGEGEGGGAYRGILARRRIFCDSRRYMFGPALGPSFDGSVFVAAQEEGRQHFHVASPEGRGDGGGSRTKRKGGGF